MLITDWESYGSGSKSDSCIRLAVYIKDLKHGLYLKKMTEKMFKVM